ncbi:MAG: MFS transporter [Anaerofustis sp.]
MDNQNKSKMILLLGFMAFLANGDNYAAAPLLLNIATDLHLSVETAAVSVTAYMLAFGAFTLLFGPLSDRFGKVKIINIAAMGTALFSILGGFAFNLTSLIFLRAMNGAFAAGIFPVTMALVGQSYDDAHRHKALGKVMGLMFLGGASATAIGGALAYFGSWRVVYIAYGAAELIAALLMLKLLQRDTPVISTLNYVKAYREPLGNPKFMRIVLTIFFVGFSVFGTFTYSGKLLQQLTGYDVLGVGLILSLFGLGTVLGGRLAPKLKQRTGARYFILTGVLGSLSLYALSAGRSLYLLVPGLFFFGVAFIFLQSTLVAAAQETLPKTRGTAMSMASFNMFVGGAIGTGINAKIIGASGIPTIYLIASVIMLLIGFAAYAQFKEKKN